MSSGSLEVFGKMPRCDVNPWVNATWRVTAAERLKMAVGAPWLIPARLGLIAIAIVTAVLFSKLALIGWNGRPEERPRKPLWRPSLLERALRTFRRRRHRARVAQANATSSKRGDVEDVDRLVDSQPPEAAGLLFPDTVPMPPWRRLLGSPVLLSVRLILLSVGFWRVQVLGKDRLSDAARVVVCNHVSMIEPLLLLLALRATPVTSAEFAKLPGIGPVGKLYQLLWLDRGSVASREAVLDAIAQRCARPGFPPVLVFPEGTTLNGRALISFKNGAFTPGAPVQPAIAKFPYRVMCGLGLDCSWTTAGPQFAELCVRMMLQPWNRLKVEFLPAYMPSLEEQREPAVFAANVRNAMARALGVPTTEHSWADMWLNMAAKDLGEPPHKTLVSLGALKAFLGGRAYERERAARALKRFASADLEKDGALTLDQFRAALRGTDDDDNTHKRLKTERLLDADAVDTLFRLLSRDSLTVDFFSFLVGFALLDADERDADTALRVVFALLDSSNEGVVNWTRLSAALTEWTDHETKPGASQDDADFVDDDAFVNALQTHPDNFLTCDEFITFVKSNRVDLRRLAFNKTSLENQGGTQAPMSP